MQVINSDHVTFSSTDAAVRASRAWAATRTALSLAWTWVRRTVRPAGVLAVATAMDAIRGDLWFGSVRIAGFTLHPLVLVFAVSGSLMISRIRVPKP